MIELLQPIINKLAEVFGEEIPIYTEKQEQGVETPCFFVRLSVAELVGQFDNFYYFNNLVTITYMSPTGDQYDLEKIRFKMLAGMDHVQTVKGVHGLNLQARIQDKDIVFTGNYNMWIEKLKIPDPNMLTLEQTHYVKGD